MSLALGIYAALATLAAVLLAISRREAETWLRRWQKMHADACDRANEWSAKARPHEATRAEWERTRGENVDLRRAKRILRRRLRGVLYEARRWKAEAIDRGWTREEHLRDRRAAKALRRHAPAEALAILSEPSAITRIEVPALSPEDRAALAALDCGGLLDAKGSE